MSNIRRTRAPLVVALASGLVLGACSTLSGDEPRGTTSTEAAEELRVVRYRVEPGDRLAAIALEFTGDAALWRTIADLNGIDDPRRLAAGRVLEIPVALIPEADREARLAASVPAGPDDGVDPGTEGDGAEGADAGNAATRLAEMRRRAAPGAPAIGDEPARATVPVPAGTARDGSVRVATVPVVVSPVRSREAFELSPLDGTESVAASGSRFVKVVGSYTPKGVYEQPAGQSRVLMRITPGTVLPLERTVDGWYRVLTSAGPGYLRDGDAQIVEGGAAAPGSPGSPGTGDPAGPATGPGG